MLTGMVSGRMGDSMHYGSGNGSNQCLVVAMVLLAFGLILTIISLSSDDPVDRMNAAYRRDEAYQQYLQQRALGQPYK